MAVGEEYQVLHHHHQRTPTTVLAEAAAKSKAGAAPQKKEELAELAELGVHYGTGVLSHSYYIGIDFFLHGLILFVDWLDSTVGHPYRIKSIEVYRSSL